MTWRDAVTVAVTVMLERTALVPLQIIEEIVPFIDHQNDWPRKFGYLYTETTIRTTDPYERGAAMG